MRTPLSRRALLRGGLGLGGLAAAPTLLPASAAAGEPDWARVRDHFALGEGITPMNAANLAPLLHPVALKLTGYARHLNQDVSFINRRDLVKDKLHDARRAVARMLGVRDPEDIAFVRNTSEANSVICQGLDLAASDEVLLWDQNHATNHRSWYYRQQRTPFTIREVQLPDQPRSAEQLIEAFLSRLSRKTRVVSFTELSNISGIRLPSQKLCRAIHDHNPDIFIHVDGAQSWGCLDLDLREMGCDSFSSSCHKWLMGPRGTGILYVRDEWAPRLWPSTLGYDFLLDYPLQELPDTARRFECLGQRDVAPYAAIGDGIALYQQLGGSAAVERRIAALTQYTLSALDKAGIRAITPRDPELGHAVVIIDLGSALSAYGAFLALHNQGIASAFVSGSRVCCSPSAGQPHDDAPTYLRLSPHIYNSFEDIDRAVAVVQRIQRSRFEIIKEVVRFL